MPGKCATARSATTARKSIIPPTSGFAPPDDARDRTECSSSMGSRAKRLDLFGGWPVAVVDGGRVRHRARLHRVHAQRRHDRGALALQCHRSCGAAPQQPQLDEWPFPDVSRRLRRHSARQLGEVLLSTALAGANITEIGTAVWLVRRFDGDVIDIRRPRSMFLFVLLAGGLAPLVSATIGAMAVHAAHAGPWSSIWLVWYAADALGIIIVAPFALMLNAEHWRALHMEKRIFEALGILVLIILVAGFASYQRSFLFIVVPAVLLATLRFGIVGAAAGTFVVALLSSVFVIKGFGPPVLSQVSFPERILALQIFFGRYRIVVPAGRRRACRAGPLARAAIGGESRCRSGQRIEIPGARCPEAPFVECSRRGTPAIGARAS
jgi:hypothetical protein